MVTRLLGVGLAAALAAVTVVLAVTGQLSLYINPDAAWFAVSMAVLALVGAVASFALPPGAEADHGHDHGDGRAHGHDHDGAHASAAADAAPSSRRAAREAQRAQTEAAGRADRRRRLPTVGAVVIGAGGALATGFVAVMLITPPAVLSAELAMSRDVGAPPLFQDADTVLLAATGDTDSFGVGDWATVFATSTDPEAFAGTPVALTGFVTPSEDGDGFQLTRMIITHCVIDAQPAIVPVTGAVTGYETGDWVDVTGTVRDVDGALVVEAAEVAATAQPEDPYEY